MVEPRQPGKAGFPEQREMDREGQRTQPGIRADVAGRALAPDVLLARRQGQHPAAPALGVDRLAGKTARHLANEFVAAGKEPEMGPAETERVAERLALGGDDVGIHFAGRPDRTQRQDLGDDDDQQRPPLMTGLRQRRPVAQLAPEIGVLHDDAGGGVIDAAGPAVLRSPAPAAVPRGRSRQSAHRSRRPRDNAGAGRPTAPPASAR